MSVRLSVSDSNLQDICCVFSEVLSVRELENAVSEAASYIIPGAIQTSLLVGTRLHGFDGAIQLGPLHPLFQCIAQDISVLSEGLIKKEIEHVVHKHKHKNIVVIRFCRPNSDSKNLDAVALVSSNESVSDQQLGLFAFFHRQIEIGIKRIISLKKTRQSISEREMADRSLIELCDSLVGEDSGRLQRKILLYLMQRTQSDSGCILMVMSGSSLFACSVIGNNILDENIYISFESGLFQDVVGLGNTLMLPSLSPEQQESLKTLTAAGLPLAKSFLCVPLTSKNTGKRVAVCCLVGKENDEFFTDEDYWITTECFRYTGPVLTYTSTFQTELYLRGQTEMKRYGEDFSHLHYDMVKKMLHVVRNIFSKMDNLELLLREIMTEARKLTNAERCSVFLVDHESKELVSKVFDGLDKIYLGNECEEENSERVPTEDHESLEHLKEMRIPLDKGIAGKVATTGILMNIQNAYEHPLFSSVVDQKTGFKTRNLLSFPIQDQDGTLMGVAQLCNKLGGKCFTKLDEEVAKAFSVYCCISIVHTLMYKRAKDAKNRHRLANELMLHHMGSKEKNIPKLVNSKLVPCKELGPDFDRFNGIPRTIPELDTLYATMCMCEEIGVFSKWKISRHTTARFLCFVRRGYRDVPYHNWYHGFSVGHFAYLCIKRLELHYQILLDIEVIALFIAALCHDIDHRGTNNSFQEKSQNVLAALYSSEGSVLEHHHFAQTVCLLNSKGCNIFENFSKQEYTRVLDVIRDVILATDIAHHLRLRTELQALADSETIKIFRSSSGSINRTSVTQPRLSLRNRQLILCMIISSADLSDQTKSWSHTRAIAELVCQEFFSQGDLEKAMGKTPSSMMDRTRASVPKMQTGFLDFIVLPLFKILSEIFPTTKCLLDNVNRNRSNWQKISDLLDAGKIKGEPDDLFRKKLVDDDYDEKVTKP